MVAAMEDATAATRDPANWLADACCTQRRRWLRCCRCEPVMSSAAMLLLCQREEFQHNTAQRGSLASRGNHGKATLDSSGHQGRVRTPGACAPVRKRRQLALAWCDCGRRLRARGCDCAMRRCRRRGTHCAPSKCAGGVRRDRRPRGSARGRGSAFGGRIEPPPAAERATVGHPGRAPIGSATHCWPHARQ